MLNPYMLFFLSTKFNYKNYFISIGKIYLSRLIYDEKVYVHKASYKNRRLLNLFFQLSFLKIAVIVDHFLATAYSSVV
jgi:hypothetical protein